MPHATRAGDLLAERYRLVDLLSESGGGRFWRAHDKVLERHVALHVIAADDPRADGLLAAARRSATVLDQRILRVLDAERVDGFCFVVNEWGSGTSLDIMLASNGPLSPRRGAWLVAEVADSVAVAHAHGVAHGLLSPENVLLDQTGSVRIIGFCVDAALHGLPAGDPHHDVLDLAGLLHATLTGRWAGPSPSAVPHVPETHGRLLRPRQVRAGVPRPLDDLCDEVLNPRGRGVRDPRDLASVASARGIHAALAEFVGDPAGIGEAIASGNPEKVETVVLPAVPEILVRPDPDDWRPPPDPEPEPEPEPDPAPKPEPIVDDRPTQRGLPIFDDENDEVSWLQAREEKPPPPPPFEEPPERPLFASEPRRPRPHADLGTVVARGDEYWPYDHDRPRDPAYDEDGGETDDRVPGRSWLRLAAVVAVVLLLVVALAIAFNLSRGRTPLGAEPDEPTPSLSTTPTPSVAVAPFPLVTATDFDPEGDDGAENPEEAPNVVDGDDATSWSTLTYRQQFGDTGLKDGVGVVVDLGESREVRQVDLTTVGDTGASIYVLADPPTTLDGLTPAGELSTTPRGSLVLPKAVAGRYVLVWLTALPPADGGFRGEIVDVVVQG